MIRENSTLPDLMPAGRNRGSGTSRFAGASMAALVAIVVAMRAGAQAEVEQGAPMVLEEIVVTGTLLRGEKPTGVEVIGMSLEEVQATGATSATQLLQSIPQFGSFNNLQSPVGAFNNVTTNRPNLRNLPGFQTAGSSTTLTLFDGHRIVGMGVSSTTPDPDIVPPGALQRLEIVPDGGSAIYGSDAVAGVVNFITRRDVEGVEIDLRDGFADDYDTFDGSISAGHKWENASAYISYNHSQHSQLKGEDRDYVKFYPTMLEGVPFQVTGITCNPGNLQPTSGAFGPIYALGDQSNLVPNTANQCDPTDEVSYYPKEDRDSLLFGGAYDFSDRLRLDVRGFYMERDVRSSLGPNVATQYLGPPGLPIEGLTSTPYYSDYAVEGGFAHKVDAAFGPSNQQKLDMDAWGVFPTLAFDLGNGWQVRTLASYGESSTTNHVQAYNMAVLPVGTESGLLNPYDLEGGSNPQAYAALLNSETYGKTEQSLFDGSVIADGALFSIPGGEVKLAVGGEYAHEQFETRNGVLAARGTETTGYPGLVIDGTELIAPQAPLPKVHQDRNVSSLFSELVIPIVGVDNALPGVQEVTLAASGRYDDYSDFGSTFNPKFGLTYRPVEWVSLRGSWGESFVAPSLADDELSVPGSSNYANISFLYPPEELQGGNPYPDVAPGQYVVVVLGNAPDIEPQHATTKSFGIDIQPPGVENLDLNLTWWKIEYQDLIAIPDFTNAPVFWSAFGDFATVNPTQAQLDALGASTSIVGNCGPSPECVYAIMDARKNNTGDFKVDGLDFGATYVYDTGFGQIDFSLNTTYELNREQTGAPGAPYVNLLSANVSRFQGSATIGTQYHQLRAEITLFHTGGYDVDPPVGINDSQGSVDAYDVVNLFFKYDVDGAGLLENLALTLNVSNVFDEDPPEYQVQNTLTPSASGYANGRSIGRLVQLGVSKRF